MGEEQRAFVRHPTDVPIRLVDTQFGAVQGTQRPLNNVGISGLCFQSPEPIERGKMVRVHIAVVQPAFETRARVAWCRQTNAHWDVGLELVEPEKRFQARMVEQICQIEHYKRAVLKTEGRELSGQEAALEWIQKNAAFFPRDGEG